MTAMNTEKTNYFGILSKYFFNLCEFYQINDENLKVILQANSHEILKFKRQKTLPFNQYYTDIINLFSEIHMYLRSIFNNQNSIISKYFHIKRNYFSNMSILEYITQSETAVIKNLKEVSRYLKNNFHK